MTGTGSQALLQRPISVAGTATIQTTMNFQNNPTMTVAGQTIIDGSTTGTGTISSGSFDFQFGTISACLAGGSLTKDTSGTATLSGSNTYTGPTTINQGELVVDGLLHQFGRQRQRRHLGRHGLSWQRSVCAGGTLAPGDPQGVLQLSGNLALASGAVMAYDLDGVSTDDEVSMPSGTLTFSGQQFSNFGFTWTAGFGPGTYTWSTPSRSPAWGATSAARSMVCRRRCRYKQRSACSPSCRSRGRWHCCASAS